ncbi:hypothetical protein COX93_00355 [Candidatus Nomurabacteria bacterium CG_4_10_14_0_2_um_filter_30_12]|uniref:dTDP-4-dehydrorhamnose reductase n=2 Tax=Candidatus Nomuraibacteriota TaxID=1752729 RepID=A0A2H0CG50_9BACT|nr:MAG: hypothetical protein COW91_03200 [Candidatus Nomurabacteria bacterium CG22_combo_CG10-13_8_21_14_all_32_8]PIZ87690.1 MAG: hypothetical protein COX93_00355 [Candidatus Nomurabacteria bacterium CG_4_10_14_0_2_um_filter_30_12]
MNKILILGHKGMLGDAVFRYFRKNKNFAVITIEERWPGQDFKGKITTLDADLIINCIGKIPQKKPTRYAYKIVNYDLPIFLETLGVPVIHPSTDCEFSGLLEVGKKYSKTDIRDADDEYGKSKALISKMIEDEFLNTKIIRTSIIGHEKVSSNSLLEWFLLQDEEVSGYNNHYWNGITTLEWAKIAEKIILNWDFYTVLNQFSCKECLSKYQVLCLIKKVYKKNIIITPFLTPQTINKCLESDEPLPDLRSQLSDLYEFYKC